MWRQNYTVEEHPKLLFPIAANQPSADRFRFDATCLPQIELPTAYHRDDQGKFPFLNSVGGTQKRRPRIRGKQLFYLHPWIIHICRVKCFRSWHKLAYFATTPGFPPSGRVDYRRGKGGEGNPPTGHWVGTGRGEAGKTSFNIYFFIRSAQRRV